MDNATWSVNASSVSANVTTSPDGTANADKLVEDSALSNTHRLFNTTGITLTAATYAFSGFFKTAGRRYVHIRLFDGTAGNYGKCLDLNTGTLVAGFFDGANALTAPTTSSVTALANSWFYVQMTFTGTAAGSLIVVYLSDSPTTTNYTGDGASGAYVWQLQLELGAFATSPIVTTAATVTRTVDDETLASSLFPLSATVGTLYAKFIPLDVSAEHRALQIDDGTANNRFVLGSSAAASGFSGVYSAGVDQAPLSNGTLTANTAVKIAMAWAGNDFALCVNGGTVQTDALGTIPTVTTLRLGAGAAGASMLNGWLAQVAYFPRRRPNGELQTLTT